MKTILVLTFALLSVASFARSKNLEVQKAMKTYVNELVDQNGYLPIIHEGKVLKLSVAKTEKYPDGFHSRVKEQGHLHASCADFVDAKGKKYDIDFLVSASHNGYKVVQPIVHSINGKKSKYDLQH